MKPYMEDPLKREREGVHLIIGGTDTGHLCVLDSDKGDTQCVVKVKERGGGERKEGIEWGERENRRREGEGCVLDVYMLLHVHVYRILD